jgi:hypothetical protein
MSITHSFKRGNLYKDRGEKSSYVIHYEIKYNTLKLEDLKFCTDQIRDMWIRNQEERDRYVHLLGSSNGGKEYELAVLESFQFCSILLCRRIASKSKEFEHLYIREGTEIRRDLSEAEIEKVIISAFI